MEDSPFFGSIAGSTSGAQAAWRGLTALADWRNGRPSGRELADQIARDTSAAQSSVAIRNLLHEILVDARADLDGPAVVADVSELILHLPPAILSSIVSSETSERRRGEFLGGCADRLSIDAALRLTWALASASERIYPESVRNVVKKLAARSNSLAGTAAGPEAEALMREQLRRQCSAWTRPRRAGLVAGLDPIVDSMDRRASGRATPDSERIVEMAIEADALGAAVHLAVQEVVDDGGTARVIELIKKAPEDSSAAAALMKRIATPNELRRLLREEPFDGAAVDALLRGMGLAAANVLLEELVESTQRLTRRYLMERLARFGAEIRPLVEGRLRDQRWFVQRNMLALLRSARCPADLTLASKYMQHKDARVRREAVLWCLETPATRDEALAAALADRDVTVMRPAMQSSRSRLPTSAVPVLAKRLLDSDFPPEFRVLSLNLLGRASSALALEAMLHFAQNGKTLLGKPRLADKSPEMLAAIGGLARSWTRERRAASLIAQAGKSRDRDVLAAVRGNVEEAA